MYLDTAYPAIVKSGDESVVVGRIMTFPNNIFPYVLDSFVNVTEIDINFFKKGFCLRDEEKN